MKSQECHELVYDSVGKTLKNDGNLANSTEWLLRLRVSRLN